jgi:hypothetical protein
MGQKWRFKDIIDLEFFLHRNETGKNDTISSFSDSSNRKFYLEFAKTHTAPFSRRELLKYWVEHQRKIERQGKGPSSQTPGEAFYESYRVVRTILILIALISGASASWGLMSYRGDDPINVFTLLWVLIVPQIFLLAVLFLSSVMRHMGGLKNISGIYPLVTDLICGFAFKLKNVGKNSLSAARRNRLGDALGFLDRQKILYGSVLFWPIFSLFQIFGGCFNIGLLGALLIKVTVTDLAFGWQSTLMVTAEALHRFIGYVSLPWSWIAPPPYAHPTLSQIEGSKIVLKDGIANFATADLVSWWPFLCFVFLFYGLLPRLFLLAFGIWRQHRALNRIDFAHADCDRLVQNMQTPQLATMSRAYQREVEPSSSKGKPETEGHEPLPNSGLSTSAAIVFVPEDIDTLFAEEDLTGRIHSLLRLRTLGRIRLSMDSRKDIAALKNLMDQTDASLSAARLVILQEAWQPPIRETVSWIGNLRRAAGKKTGIIVGLIGKPAREIKFTSPEDSDMLIWDHVINSMGDPYIRIENLGG